eukprot:jgi/Tetstr1/462001/TSEL_007072.t1
MSARSRPAVAARRNSIRVAATAHPAVDVVAVVTSSRRSLLLGAGAAAVAVLSAAPEAQASYGEAARVFGSKTKNSEFTSFVGDGYALDIPAKWNPDNSISRGSQLRYADNMRDDGGNLDVIIQTAEKGTIEEYGDLREFLPKISYLLGQQSYDGKTDSEGGFKSGRVAAGSILDQDVVTDKKGKSYYYYHILTRTADGEGGGRHHLLVSTVANGNLYTFQIQALDKQWFKGFDKVMEGCAKSFTVA